MNINKNLYELSLLYFLVFLTFLLVYQNSYADKLSNDQGIIINRNQEMIATDLQYVIFNSKLYLTWSELNQVGKCQIRIAEFNHELL